MSNPSKISRRRFLSRSAAVTGGVVSLGVLGIARKTPGQEGGLPRTFQSFTEHEGLTIEAMAEKIFPRDRLGPGATDAHVIDYIDRALATHRAADKETYKKGIAWVDELCTTVIGRPFVELDSELQNEVLSAMDQKESAVGWPETAEMSSRDFLRLVIKHTMEGMFSDPQYGGNYNGIGWKLINFPGPKAFGYDPPFGWYDMIFPELEYPPFKPYTGPGKKKK